jgi:hypothetical protein
MKKLDGFSLWQTDQLIRANPRANIVENTNGPIHLTFYLCCQFQWGVGGKVLCTQVQSLQLRGTRDGDERHRISSDVAELPTCSVWLHQPFLNMLSKAQADGTLTGCKPLVRTVASRGSLYSGKKVFGQ